MSKKKIYFADLTYNTGGVSNDLFPLGIGYVAAYAKSFLPESVGIELFKYTDEFLKKIETDPPDIFAGSCYVWNRSLVLLISRMIKEVNPGCLVVLGGLSFPLDAKRQLELLSKNPHVDYFVPYDGEIGFYNIAKKYLELGGDTSSLRDHAPAGSVHIDRSGRLVDGGRTKRPSNLDEYPSPYLTGLFDKYFVGRHHTPLMQATRGCPNTCTYCWASNPENRIVSSFSLGRVKAELDYISERAVKNEIYDLVICDSNFGLYEKDFEIIDYIAALQEKVGYPRIFNAPYGKRTDVEYVRRFSRLKGVTYCLPLQSTNTKVLENVKRRKVDLKAISDFVDTVHEMGKHIGTEIITGLPHETRETHIKTLRDLMDCGFDIVDPFTLMLLDGIELDSEESHERYNYDIRYRLIPRNFGTIKGRRSFEIERVVVGTNTYTYDDYIFFRSLHGLIRMLVNNAIYYELMQYLKERGVHLLDWILYVFEDLKKGKNTATTAFDAFVEEAKTELWDSPEAIIDYYSKEENYSKLLKRDRGDNLMQKYGVLASTIYFDAYVDYFIAMANRYLITESPQDSGKIASETEDLGKFISSKLSGVITKNIKKALRFEVKHNISKWIRDGFSKPLSGYRALRPIIMIAELSEEQVELISNVFKRYDVDEKNPYGMYKTIPYIYVDNYFRKIAPADEYEKVSGGVK